QEGIAREFVNRIQNIRKSSGFDITDKIDIVIDRNQETDKAVEIYKDYIAKQVLANNISFSENLPDSATFLDFDSFSLKISVTKS
ncbi:MAG: DUF5915 domain-containing protein, partial [Bacteroidales bacterium]